MSIRIREFNGSCPCRRCQGFLPGAGIVLSSAEAEAHRRSVANRNLGPKLSADRLAKLARRRKARSGRRAKRFG